MYVLRTPIASGANLVGKVYTIVELKQRGSVITDWPTFLKFLQWSAQLSLFLAFVDLFDWFCGRHWKFLSCFEIVTLTPFLEFLNLSNKSRTIVTMSDIKLTNIFCLVALYLDQGYFQIWHLLIIFFSFLINFNVYTQGSTEGRFLKLG